MSILKQKNKEEKNARQFMVLIQVILVQSVCNLAKKENKEWKEISVLALLHGIALLFVNLERAQKDNLLDKEHVLKLKEQVIMANMKFAFDKKDITYERVEGFSKMVYEILKQTGCNGSESEQVTEERMKQSLCGNIQLENEEEIEEKLKQLQLYFNRELEKICRKGGKESRVPAFGK